MDDLIVLVSCCGRYEIFSGGTGALHMVFRRHWMVLDSSE